MIDKPAIAEKFFFLLLWVSSIVVSSAYEGCQNEFAISAETCAKFDFGSNGANGTGAALRCYDMDKNMNTYYGLNALPKVTWIDPKVIQMASLVTNVFENGNKVFGYA